MATCDMETIDISESDMIKVILEFLQNHNLVSSVLSVERETGVSNTDVASALDEKVHWLRQLIELGLFDKAFILAGECCHLLNPRQARLCILNHQYLEWLYSFGQRDETAVGLRPPSHQVKFELADFQRSMRQLDESAVLPTQLPSGFSVEQNRLDCADEVMTCLDPATTGESCGKGAAADCSGAPRALPTVSRNDRLVQLVVKGLLYELCVDYCQASSVVTSSDSIETRPSAPRLLTDANLTHTDVALLSWLYALPREIFDISFIQRRLKVNMQSLEESKDRDERSDFVGSGLDSRVQQKETVAQSIRAPAAAPSDFTHVPESPAMAKPRVNSPFRYRTSSDKTNNSTSTALSSPSPFRARKVNVSSTTADVGRDVTEGGGMRYVRVAQLDDSQAIRAVSVHPSGKYLAIGSNSKILRVCEWPVTCSDQQIGDVPLKVIGQIPKQHSGSIFCLCWHPDGNLLASGSNDKCAKLVVFDEDQLDVSPFVSCEDVKLHHGTVRDVCFLQADDDNSTGCSILLSAGAGECQIVATDINTRKTVGQFVGSHTMPIFSLSAASRNEFVSSSQDGRICLWDARATSSQPMKCVAVDSTAVTSVHTCNPSSIVGVHRYLTSGHSDGSVRLWDLRNFAHCQDRALCIYRCSDVHQGQVRSVRFKPALLNPPFAGSRQALSVLSASYDNCINLSDFHVSGDGSRSSRSHTVGRHFAKAVAVRWHPKLDAFVSTSADKSCVVWKAVSALGFTGFTTNSVISNGGNF